MITHRKSAERGHVNHDWLDTKHTFSFATYYDPQWMGFRELRVINQDIVQPGRGFAPHSHRDMEIITLVLQGAITHKDSMGNEATIRPGEIQRMTAGTGVTHSEYNSSGTELLELLQIWIIPEQPGLEPGYQQLQYQKPQNSLRLLASGNGEEHVVHIHQNTKLWLGQLDAQRSLTYTLAPNRRHVWLQMITGNMELNGIELTTGDGAAMSDESSAVMQANSNTEFLLFDLN